MNKTYRERSREEWAPITEKPNDQQIAIGCLQRIADATEKMAGSYRELIGERNFFKGQMEYWRSQHEYVERRIRSLRGYITRLKKGGRR